MLVGILSLVLSVFAADSPPVQKQQQNKLLNVKSFVKDGEFVTELTFDKNFDEINIATDYINETVQFNIPNIKLPRTKLSNPITDNKVQSVFAYRLNDNMTRVRVIYKKGQFAEAFKAGTVIENEGRILRFRIADRKDIVVKEPEPPRSASSDVAENDAKSEPANDDDLKQANSWIDQAKTTQAEAAVATTAPVVTVAAASAADLSESQIPVLAGADTTKKIKKESPLGRTLLSLGVVLGLIVGSYFFLKKWSKTSALKNKNTQIKVLTQHYLGPKKSLAIVRVAGESILLGITDHNISMIKSLALMDEEIPTETSSQFSNSLQIAEAKQTAIEGPFKTTEEADEFSMTKMIGAKLKGMKEI